MDIVDSEFNRIALNIQIVEGRNDENDSGKISNLKNLISNVPTDLCFWKPFGLLMAIFTFGYAWAGIPAIGFYMVSLLKKSKIPIDPFLASALLGIYRYILTDAYVELKRFSMVY